MAERGGLDPGEQAEDASPSAAAPGAADEPTRTSAAGGAVAAACMEEIVGLNWMQVG